MRSQRAGALAVREVPAHQDFQNERRPTMKRYRNRAALAAIVIAGLIAGGFAVTHYATSQAASAAAKVKAADLKYARALSEAFRDVAKTLSPSVVSIRSERTIRPAAQFRGNASIPREFRRFFDDDSFGRFFDDVPNRAFRQRSSGSGVIVSNQGYIVTNNHVIRGAETVTVTLNDKRTFSAKVVGRDEKTDVAVLKIKADDLTPARFGDSDAMQVGDWVLAVGNPFRLSQTVTAGIVSAMGRENVGITDYENFIQTDAAINPGNSGGPLVNLNGEIVGINTAIASNTGSFNGIGFAIPSNSVKRIYTSIVKTGHVQRGRIGAAIQDLTPQLAKSFGYRLNGHGVLVGDVVKNGPAAKAGLKAGDIVESFDGRPMHSAAHLRNSVAATAPGAKATMTVFRNGKTRNISVTVGKLTEDEGVASTSGEEGSASESVQDWGMTLKDVTPDLAKQLKLDDNRKGAVVTQVQSGSLASEMGIRVGDVIVSVGGQTVHNVDDFRKAIKSADLAKGVRLQVFSGGLKRFVFVQKS
jgi:serine protease Do